MKKYLILLLSLIFVIPYASAEVYIQNDQQYLGEDGSLHIVGEIQNDLDFPLNQIEVYVTLFSNDEKLDVVSTTPFVNTIMPGMKGPFDLVIFGEMVKEIQDYTLDVNYQISTPKSQVMEITSSEVSRDFLDNFVIKGTVANRGETTANTVSVVATLYDRNGDVVRVSKTQTQPDYLRADDETFFFVTIPDKIQSNQMVDFSLVAESEEYAPVPEFPLGSMILLGVSVSMYVLFTRYVSKSVPSIISATYLR